MGVSSNELGLRGSSGTKGFLRYQHKESIHGNMKKKRETEFIGGGFGQTNRDPYYEATVNQGSF